MDIMESRAEAGNCVSHSAGTEAQMRFLFNTVFYKPAKGGGGPIHSVSSFAEELVRRRADVTVATSNRDIPGSIEVATSLDHWIEGVRVRYFEARPTRLQRTG